MFQNKNIKLLNNQLFIKTILKQKIVKKEKKKRKRLWF